MTAGVPLDQLHCPTCGTRFSDFNLHSEPEDFVMDVCMGTPDILAGPRMPWYLRCPQGHRWTVKTLWRAVNYPDRVQLGEYVGCD